MDDDFEDQLILNMIYVAQRIQSDKEKAIKVLDRKWEENSAAVKYLVHFLSRYMPNHLNNDIADEYTASCRVQIYKLLKECRDFTAEMNEMLELVNHIMTTPKGKEMIHLWKFGKLSQEDQEQVRMNEFQPPPHAQERIPAAAVESSPVELPVSPVQKCVREQDAKDQVNGVDPPDEATRASDVSLVLPALADDPVSIISLVDDPYGHIGCSFDFLI